MPKHAPIAARDYSDVQIVRRLLADARPYGLHLLLVVVLALTGASLTLLLPVPLKIVVDSVIGTAPVPAIIGRVLGSGARLSGFLLTGCAVALVLLTLLQQLQGFASWALQLYVGEHLVLRFRARLFEQMQRLSLMYHDRVGTTDAVYRIQYDAPAVQYVLINGLIPLATSALTVLAMLFVIARIDVRLAIVAALVVPPLLALAEWYRRYVRDAWSRVKAQESQAMGIVQEVLSLLRVVKAFGQEARERDRFTRTSAAALRTQMGVLWSEAVFGVAASMTLAVGTATLLYVGTRATLMHTITLGQLLLVMAYVAQLFRPLEVISRTVAQLQSAFAGARRAFALLDEPQDVPASPAPIPLPRARGHIVFDHVSFAYGSNTVLDDVCLEIPEGTRVGIAGPTGAGKTTLVNLIARFHDPTAGRILLDGIDLRDYALADLRRQFSIVLQEPVLFSTTIEENIAYGCPGASRQAVIAAAVAANAHDFIDRLPSGYDTIVGERGMTLSGGERQRVALARAFLKDAPIVILDEPTSSIDLASEAIVMEAARRLMRGRTTFLIAHRLGTLAGCDSRVRVEQGRVDVTLPDEPPGIHPRVAAART